MRALHLAALVALSSSFDVYEYLQCQLCETPKPSGAIDDCCCDVETVDQVNTRHFLPVLHDLTKRTYFRYFKVDLWRSCPFWPDDGECAKEECAVCECNATEAAQCASQDWREPPPSASAASARLAPSDADEVTDERVALLSRVRTDAAKGSRPGKAAGWSLGTGSSESPRPGGTSSAASRYDEANVWSVQPASHTEAGVVPGAEEEGESSLQYVSLLANPEGYTGYAGPKASRIWQAIYGENCFTGPLEGMCLEERVFYRMLSGLQTSINTHVAMTYGGGEGVDEGADIYGERGKAGGSAGAGIVAARTLMGRAFTTALNVLSRAGGYGPFPPEPEAYAPGNGGPLSSASASSISRLVVTPGLKPSVGVYKERIGGHPERLKNLYFTFLFVVRAVAIAKPQLERMELSTGDAAEDAATRAALTRLLDVEVPSVLAGFDESRMFQVTTDEFLAGSAPAAGGGAGTCPPVLHGLGDLHELQHRYLAHVGRKAALREAFRDKYRNISRIMDCVGCEKCRLWGKLQFLGLGTAMKILFADADTTGTPGSPDLSIHLSRNELVALINVLHRLSMSMAALHVMRDLELSERLGSILASALRGVGALALGVALGRALLWMNSRGERGVRAPEAQSKAEESKSD